MQKYRKRAQISFGAQSKEKKIVQRIENAKMISFSVNSISYFRKATQKRYFVHEKTKRSYLILEKRCKKDNLKGYRHKANNHCVSQIYDTGKIHAPAQL